MEYFDYCKGLHLMVQDTIIKIDLPYILRSLLFMWAMLVDGTSLVTALFVVGVGQILLNVGLYRSLRVLSNYVIKH